MGLLVGVRDELPHSFDETLRIGQTRRYRLCHREPRAVPDRGVEAEHLEEVPVGEEHGVAGVQEQHADRRRVAHALEQRLLLIE